MQFARKWFAWVASFVVLLAPSTCAIASNAFETVMFTGQSAPGTPDLLYDHPLDQFVLNDLGQVAFLATTVGNEMGIWLHDPVQTVLIARSSTPAPGTASNFHDLRGGLALNNHGQVAFAASVGDSRIWSNASGDLQLITSRGDAIPGMTQRIGRLGALSLTDDGKVSFFSFLDGGPGTVATVWTGDVSGIDLLAQSNDGITGSPQAPGAPAGTSFQYRSGFTISHNDVGDLAIGASLVGPGINAGNGHGFWTNRSGTLAPLIRGGDPAPHNVPGATILLSPGGSGFLTIAMNDLGQVALPVGLSGPNVNQTNNSALLFENHGVTSLLARKGDLAPGTSSGTTFAGFASLIDLNDSGQIAFQAALAGASVTSQTSEGLWAGSPDNLQLIARLGDAAPGLDSGVTFSSFAPDSGGTRKFFTFNSLGQIAFQARVTGPGISNDNDVGIWATGLDGTLRLIARGGDSIEVAPGDFRNIAALPARSHGPAGFSPSFSLNNRGQIAFQANFRTGRGIFISNAVAVPEPLAASLMATALAATFYARRRAA